MWSISARNCTFDRIYERKLSMFLRMRKFFRKFLRMFLRMCILVHLHLQAIAFALARVFWCMHLHVHLQCDSVNWIIQELWDVFLAEVISSEIWTIGCFRRSRKKVPFEWPWSLQTASTQLERTVRSLEAAEGVRRSSKFVTARSVLIYY
jgi:hypothetical protein